jgi:mannan endo-1,4-beta-mannosidase
VLGSDFHYYLEKEATERGYHTDAVKWAYQQGYVITFDWHVSARGTNSYEYQGAPANLANNIATIDGDDRAWYLGELDKVIDMINEDLVVSDENIPIVFRPLHEMNGNWFWWGSAGISAANYKLLYQLTVDYVKERTTSVLFCWSPNSPFNLDRYPGDDYVDVVGVDAYEVTTTSLRQQLGAVVDYAQAHDKVAVFSETGNRTSDDVSAANYWKNIILPGITDDPTGKAKKIAWVLTWINASWSYPYVPHASSSATAKQSFVDFKNSPYTLFGGEIQTMYEPLPDVTVGISNNERLEDRDFQCYPIPSKGSVTIKLSNFKRPSHLQIFDVSGKLLHEVEASQKEFTLNLKQLLASGVYFIRASDNWKTITRKLIVQ